MSSIDAKYIVVTAVKNEELFIGATLSSMAALRGSKRIDDSELIRFLRTNQLRKLLMLKHKV